MVTVLRGFTECSGDFVVEMLYGSSPPDSGLEACAQNRHKRVVRPGRGISEPSEIRLGISSADSDLFQRRKKGGDKLGSRVPCVVDCLSVQQASLIRPPLAVLYQTRCCQPGDFLVIVQLLGINPIEGRPGSISSSQFRQTES